MLNQSVAKRYAKAFLLLAQEKNSVPQYQEELQLVSEHISSIDGFTDYLRSFLVPPEKKKELFKRAFSAVVSLSTMNFINLVIDKRRESLLLEIYEEFEALAAEANNIVKGEIYTARAVPEAALTELMASLSEKTGKKIVLIPKIDPSLIGGVVVKIGDKVVDATIKSQLASLKQRMQNAKTS